MKLVVIILVALGMPAVGLLFVNSKIPTDPPFVVPAGYQGQPECIETVRLDERGYATDRKTYELRWLNAQGKWKYAIPPQSKMECLNTNPASVFRRTYVR